MEDCAAQWVDSVFFSTVGILTFLFLSSSTELEHS